MTTIHILNGHGHDSLVIDRDDAMSVEAGRDLYNMLRDRGYQAFGGDGADMEFITSDDNLLWFPEVVLVAPIAGG